MRTSPYRLTKRKVILTSALGVVSCIDQTQPQWTQRNTGKDIETRPCVTLCTLWLVIWDTASLGYHLTNFPQAVKISASLLKRHTT